MDDQFGLDTCVTSKLGRYICCSWHVDFFHLQKSFFYLLVTTHFTFHADSEHPAAFFEGKIFNFPITSEKGASAYDRADEQQQQNIEKY